MFRLALALGCSVREVELMSAAEFDEWGNYYAVEPFGAARDNLHAGIVASVIANAARAMSGGKKSDPFKPTDFLLQTADERQKRSLAAGVAKLRGMAKRKKKAK